MTVVSEPLEPVLGVAEIAAYLDVKRPNVRKLLDRYGIEPMAELAVGPVFSREAIVALKLRRDADTATTAKNARIRATQRARHTNG